MRHKIRISALFIVLLFLLILVVATMTSGCEVLKSKQSTSSDTTYVRKETQGNVSHNESEKNSELDYWKRTWLFSQPNPSQGNGKDTVFLQSQEKSYHYTQPIAYIEEKGNLKESERIFNYDSAFRALQDSTSVRIQQNSKDKKTKVLGWEHIIAACLGTGLLLLFLQYFSKFKITKR